jgi:EAL domain-containing protein (putative c-di-GMP-specific phosphodiesterase class I)
VKLDRGLASGSNPARDQTLYRSVIKLCDDLGLVVIAEGVETAEQAEMVARAGGRLAQGHLFGVPVPVDELPDTLAAAAAAGAVRTPE